MKSWPMGAIIFNCYKVVNVHFLSVAAREEKLAAVH